MSPTSKRQPGQRAGLSSAAVFDAARSLLARDGLDALTMRALATALQVAPNTLYSHVSSKDALVDALLDDLLSQVNPPDPELVRPAEGLYEIMFSTFEVLLGQPATVPLYLARQGSRGPNAVRLGQIMGTLLRRGGIESEDEERQAIRVLIVYTIGFAAIASRPLLEDEPPAALSTEEWTTNFGNGLRWLIAGML